MPKRKCYNLLNYLNFNAELFKAVKILVDEVDRWEAKSISFNYREVKNGVLGKTREVTIEIK